MVRDKIEIQYPVLDHSESVANIGIKTTKVNPENGVTIEHAHENWKWPLFIHIINNSDKSGSLTFRAGDAFPNSMLGDLCIEIPSGISAINIHDFARFLTSDNDAINLDFNNDFDGCIYVVGKWAGVSPQ